MEDLLSRDARVNWHPFTPDPHVGPKTVWARAEGAFVYDSSGNRFFDATASWWCNIHGHCHPRLVRALAEQAARMDQVMFAPHTHSVAVELAEQLLQKLEMTGRVFYSDDGSTAVETAMKMAMQYWRLLGKPTKREFLSLQRGYHGDTLGAVSIGEVSEFHSAFKDPAATPFRVAIDNLASTRRYLDENPDRIAALVVEPLVLAAGGMQIYSATLLAELVEMCRAHQVLVIFDEVFTGFGRTGKFFAHDYLAPQHRPDITCLSKGLTSGMLPLGATVARRAIYDVFPKNQSTFFHGHTYTANPLGCAVALESLRLFDEERTLEKVGVLARLFTEAAERFRGLAPVQAVRTLGGIFAVELRAADNKPGWRICQQLWRHGIWMRPLHNILYLIPPFCTSERELQEVLAMLYSEVENATHYH